MVGALDDDHPDILPYLQDFTHYGTDMHGAQRERRSDDPHVPCDPPVQSVLTEDAVRYILQAVSDISEQDDFYGTDKFSAVMYLANQFRV